jgi:thiol-disulfide isomerase/thioredoxin
VPDKFLHLTCLWLNFVIANFKLMVMKNILILFIGLFLCENIQAQIIWLNDFNAAKSIAKNSDKLIVMDFWAIWCGPCNTMDHELWDNSEILNISKNFIGLKVNVDLEKVLTSKYSVNLIPKLIIITASGDIIWEKDGFDNAENFLPVFKAIPENVGELNKKSLSLAENNKDLQSNYSVGIEYQRLGKNIKNYELKDSFLDCSEKYLNKAQKLCKDPVLMEEMELYSILNDLYYGRPQKALKMIEKMDPKPQNEYLAEFRHFILAKCYKSTNDQDNYQKEKQQINKKEFIEQLEN